MANQDQRNPASKGTKENEEIKEISMPLLDIHIAQIVSRGSIEVPLVLNKYSVDREGKVSLFLNVNDEYRGILQINQEPLISAINIQAKDLEKILEEKSREIYGYFRYNSSSQNFNLERVEIHKKIK